MTDYFADLCELKCSRSLSVVTDGAIEPRADANFYSFCHFARFSLSLDSSRRQGLNNAPRGAQITFPRGLELPPCLVANFSRVPQGSHCSRIISGERNYFMRWYVSLNIAPVSCA